MKVHIHDNNHVPLKQNCLSEVELEPGKVLTLHVHSGECRPCPKGHCHNGSINLLIVDGHLYVVFEGEPPQGLITLAEADLHTPINHAKDIQMLSERLDLVIQDPPAVEMSARSRWLTAMAMVFLPNKMLRAVEDASRDTSVHVRVIGRLVILAEWRESAAGARYYHVLYTWPAMV